jgi:SlyX protein
MDADSTEERLKELEIKVTYQDDTIEALNQVIIELRRQLEVLTKRVDALDEQKADDAMGPLPHERPPHY